MDSREIAIRVRNLLTERSDAAVNITIPHIQALIPTAMELWADSVKSDPKAKETLTVHKSISLASGSLDLSPYINGTSGKIDLDDLRKTTIYTMISTIRTPFTWLASQAQMNSGRYMASEDPAIWLDGHTLRTRNTDGSSTSLGTATIEFDVFEIPDASTLPDTLAGSFIVFLANLAMQERAN